MFKDPNYKPKANEIKTCSGAVYRKDPDAIIPAILTHYFALRKQAKKDKKQANQEMEDLKLVENILDGNLLTYHFQPIVRASDGSIYSYEALMRSKTER